MNCTLNGRTRPDGQVETMHVIVDVLKEKCVIIVGLSPGRPLRDPEGLADTMVFDLDTFQQVAVAMACVPEFRDLQALVDARKAAPIRPDIPARDERAWRSAMRKAAGRPDSGR